MAHLVEAARADGIVHVASADDHELTDAEISAEPDFGRTYPPHCLRGLDAERTARCLAHWRERGVDSPTADFAAAAW